jgi:hypothetical protein
VIFGLGFATVLTLVMVPTMYSIAEDVRALPGRVRRRLRRSSGHPVGDDWLQDAEAEVDADVDADTEAASDAVSPNDER